MISACSGGGRLGVEQQIADGAALDQLHHDVRDGLAADDVLAGVVHGDDRVVVEAGDRLGLAREAGLGDRVLGEVGAQQLHGDGAPEPYVLGREHLGHAAAAESVGQPVAAVADQPAVAPRLRRIRHSAASRLGFGRALSALRCAISPRRRFCRAVRAVFVTGLRYGTLQPSRKPRPDRSVMDRPSNLLSSRRAKCVPAYARCNACATLLARTVTERAPRLTCPCPGADLAGNARWIIGIASAAVQCAYGGRRDMSQDGAQGRYAGRFARRRPLPAARPARRGRHGLRAPRVRLACSTARSPSRPCTPSSAASSPSASASAARPRPWPSSRTPTSSRSSTPARTMLRRHRTMPYIVMEYVEGQPLGSVLERGHPAVRRDAGRQGAEDHRRRAGRAGDQPRDGPGPPRHQARQRDDDQARRRQGDGLRHRPRHAVRRHLDDADRHGRRHPAVPLARAGAGPRRGRPLRPVLGRHHALPAADRAAAVRRGLAAGHRVRARAGGAGRPVLDQPRRCRRRWTRWSPGR